MHAILAALHSRHSADARAVDTAQLEAAVQAQKEHTKKVREESGKSTESKKVAREKTKDAKKLKEQKKQERRNRATKGERQR